MTPPSTHELGPSPDAAAIRRYLREISRSVREARGDARRHSHRHPRRRRPHTWTMSLNLTPMIDVVFLLLFFFMTVTRFSAQEGMLPAKLPAQAAAVAAEIPRTPIRVRLVPDPAAPAACRATIDRFHETPIALDLLVPALRQIREGGAGFDRNTPVHLLAADDVAWDHVVNAYNAALAAEYEKIYFAGSP